MVNRGPKPKRYRYNNKRYSLDALANLAGITRAAMYARIHYYGYSVAKAVETARSLKGKPATQYTFAGRSRTLLEWSELIDMPTGTLASRLTLGWTLEQALTTPTPTQRRRGVVSNLGAFEGTGAGRFAQETPELTFSEQASNQ